VQHDLASPAALLIRLGSLALVAYLGGFLSRRLLQEMAAHHANAERLRASEARFRALLHNAVDVVMIVSPAGTVQYVTPTVERVMGYCAADLLDTEALAIVHPDDRDQAATEIGGVLSVPGATRTRELRARHADGSWRSVEATVANLLHEPSVGGIVVNYHDVTERTAFQQLLSHQAFHDGLTGLPNRAAFRERLESALVRARGEQLGTAVLFIDLDRFKVVNDSLGHEVGDRLLIAVAERLRGLLAPEHTVARLGGDEFTVLLEAVDEAGVTKTAEALLAVLAQPVAIDRHHLTISGSIGVAFAYGDEWPDDLLRHADLALYRAKEAGKAQYAVFDAGMGARAHQRLALEADLRRALELGELCLYCQPQIDLQSGRLFGVEALVRWRHPQRGLVPPDCFIPVAEETGLMVPLGRWVLDQACREVAGWRRTWPLAASLRVSVNVSPLQFHQPFLVEEVAEALQTADLPAEALELEITERALMRDDTAAARSIAALHELGVSLAIDDFGTGYSALGYLRRYPVHTLKSVRNQVSHRR
jgi:diguanylate cyclase (GGDEF)-like protein/PAS domain S-box-containing protein